jgi:hypothetical protein
MKIVVSRRDLQAAAIFASTDDNRPTLNGVNIEVREGIAEPCVVATDGRRLVAIESQAEQQQDFDRPHSVLLRADFLKAICQLSKTFGGQVFPLICFEHNPGSKRLSVSLIGAPVVLEIEVGAIIEGEFPDWRRVMPAKNMRRESISEIGINSEFIGDFAKAAKILECNTPVVQLHLVGKEQQIEVKLDGLANFYGLVMQCKLEEVDYQPEFTQIIEQLPAPEKAEAEPAETEEQEAVPA